MNKNGLRFTGFWLVFMLLFMWLNSATGQELNRWKDFYNIPRNSIDVLFLGNSHSGYTFQPQIINNVLPVNAYSLGIEGENIFISYFELREALKYQKPKLVVLETFTLNLTEPLESALIFQFTDAGVWNLNKEAVLARFLPLEIAYSAIPAFHTRVNWNEPASFFLKLKEPFVYGYHPISPRMGASVIPETMQKEEFLAAADLPDPTYSNSAEENQKYLDKFVALCEKNDIQLILVTSPVLNTSTGDLRYFTPFDVSSYARENNIDLITFDGLELNELHYGNPDHVSAFGSVIVSMKMADEISRRLNIPTNEEQRDFYDSFVFTEYSLNHTGYNYSLTLVPEDPDLDLLYKFTLFESNYNQVLATEWQADPQFRFTVPRMNYYTIDVEIADTNNKYQMLGEFYVLDEDLGIE